MKIAAMMNQDFQSALLALGNERVSMPVAYRIKKIVKRINEELQNYNSVLSDLQKKHKGEDGQVNQEAFMKDYVELVNMEIEMDKIKLSEIMHTTVSTKDLVLLDPILVDDSEGQA